MAASADIALQDLPQCLQAHAERSITFFSTGSIHRVTFGEFYLEVQRGAEAASMLGIAAGAIVGVLAADKRAVLLVDLVLLALRATVVQLPESGPTKSVSEEAGACDFLLVEADFARHVPGESFAAIGALAGLRVYRGTTSQPRDPRVEDSPAIIFSSGTSGRIKKLIVSRQGVIYNARVFVNFLAPVHDDQFLLFLPLSNYQQKLIFYGCLIAGMDVCVSDPKAVFAALKRQKPTLFLAPPLFYESACSLARDSGASSASADHGRAPRDSLSELFGGRMRRMYSGMAPIAPAILELYRSAGLPIFEAYGMTEYGPIAANGPDANVIGSVGRPLVSGSVALTDDGEIVVRSPRPLTIGYLGALTEAERLVYLDDAAIATGDIGHFDERGFLFIDGRKKQIIITSQGYKIHPESIERRFHGVPALLHVVVMGDGLAELGLLAIVERLEAGVRERVADIVSELNAGPCRLHPIRKVRLSSERFTVDNGLLTANLKLHRPNIIACYQDQVFGS